MNHQVWSRRALPYVQAQVAATNLLKRLPRPNYFWGSTLLLLSGRCCDEVLLCLSHYRSAPRWPPFLAFPRGIGHWQPKRRRLRLGGAIDTQFQDGPARPQCMRVYRSRSRVVRSMSIVSDCPVAHYNASYREPVDLGSFSAGRARL